MKLLILLLAVSVTGCAQYKLVQVGEVTRTAEMQLQEYACQDHRGVREYAIDDIGIVLCKDRKWQEWQYVFAV